jgi:putative transposase
MQIRDPKTGKLFYQKRLQRFEEGRMPRELTFSCFRGYKFFAKDRTCQWFIDSLEELRQTWPIDLWAYCIMPEHVHLILAPRASNLPIGKIFGRCKERVARQAIQWLSENQPKWIHRITVIEGDVTRRRFWQPGGGYDRNVEEVATLQKMIDYIHMNPVRRGLVLKPTDWRWSSAAWYAGQTDVPLLMDKTLPMQYLLGC